jgi:phosphoenolpyruvate-protein phosphotransferase (PTS system enzyme I)
MVSNTDLQEIRLTGFVISSGIAIGKPFFLKTLQKTFQEENIHPNKIEEEVKRFNGAVDSVVQDLQTIRKQLELEGVLEGIAILEGQLQLLSDPSLIEEVKKRIRAKRKISEYILQQLIQEYQKKFDAIGDSFFRERFKDVQDISVRILSYLLKEAKGALNDLKADSILFAKDISPSETAEASQKRVRAIVSEKGSTTAHASILARAKEIPYMTNISLAVVANHLESLMIVDGKGGQLIINPTKETLARYEKMCDELTNNRIRLGKADFYSAETYDGYQMKLMANIETCSEIAKIHEYGGQGVGLYRSENLLVGRNSIPTEEEQFQVYRELIENMRELPITIRTFDVGRDKPGINIRHGQSGNAFLGFRGIGNMEQEREIFKTQLRAILRASVFGWVNVLFPMVSSLQELKHAKQLLNEAAQQLNIEPNISVGCMIEVPSAAIISDLLARECDFLSIGTNDLIHHTLAVDRCDHSLSHLYQPTHPSILRLIQHVVTEANRNNVPVSICGEVAANPRFTPLLLGLGIHEISVAARYIPLIRHAIRYSNFLSCCQLAEQALTMSSAAEIYELLDSAFENHFARASLEELM